MWGLSPKPVDTLSWPQKGIDDSLSSLLLYSRTGPRRALSLKLGDTRVYEPEKRTRLGRKRERCHARLHPPRRLWGRERERGREGERERHEAPRAPWATPSAAQTAG